MSGKTKRIVLTGGPCAGKTTCLRELGRQQGPNVILVPEASTLLLSGNIPPPMGHPDWPKTLLDKERWRRAFQAQIVATQIHLETTMQALAEEAGAKAIICDRGLLDGAAYWPEGLEDFLRNFGLNLDQIHARYDLVIQLESVVVGNRNRFDRDNNPTRFEDPKEALLREQLSREVWSSHPNRVFIESGSIEKKIRTATDAVARILENGNSPGPLFGRGS